MVEVGPEELYYLPSRRAVKNMDSCVYLAAATVRLG